MKVLLVAVMVAAGTMGAFADYGYLNFVIDQSAAEKPVDFEYARIGVAGEGAYLNMQGTTSPWVLGNGDGTAPQNWADLGAYNSPLYSYFVELYDIDFNAIAASDAFGYEALMPYIGTPMGQGGVTPWTVGDFHSVPEPTSGVLILLGVGLLALRRRSARRADPTGSAAQRRRSARRADPTGVCLAVVLACGMAFGAENDTLITFSTPGTDRYADGTAVRDGECYALVWVKDGAEFAGIAADGTVVDPATSAILLSAPVAKGGRCPSVVFELDAALAKRYEGGAFSVYLLDTRNAAGRVRGIGANGRVVAVNGYGKAGGVGEGEPKKDALFAAKGGGVAVVAKSALPKDAPKPLIKAMKVLGGNVYLTVSGTLPCLQYRPERVALGGKAETEAGQPVDGKAGEDVILVMPAKGNSGFFRVGRN